MVIKDSNLPEDLGQVMPDLNDSWRVVAEFAAKFPLRVTHGESGELITRGTLRTATEPVYESGDDDELNSDM